MSISEYDLGFLADKLSANFPSIRELYLFGSRRYATKSPRSDIDILVVADEHIRPKAMRDFTDSECSALDLFLVSGSKATSVQNESYVEAGSFDELVSSLNAAKIWTRESGRTTAPINWIAEVDDGIVFERTILPNMHVADEHRADRIDLDKVTLDQFRKSLTTKQAWGVLVALFVASGAIFGFGYNVGKFVESTKTATEKSDVTTDQEESNSPATNGALRVNTSPQGVEPKPEISLHVISSINVDEEGDVRSSLRSNRGLRQLEELESDKPIADTASRTFFFVRTGYLEVRDDQTHEEILNGRVERYGDMPNIQFELHHISPSELYLVGFVSETDLVSVARLDGTTLKQATVFPKPHGTALNLISIPIDRILRASERELDLGRGSIDVLDIFLQ